jgi:hypothetical protein
MTLVGMRVFVVRLGGCRYRNHRPLKEQIEMSKRCKYGDPTCPCPDGDLCHYEGSKPWSVPPEYVRNAINDKNAELVALKAGYAECIEDMADWAAYVGDYFRQKNDIDGDGDIKRHKANLSVSGTGENDD